MNRSPAFDALYNELLAEAMVGVRIANQSPQEGQPMVHLRTRAMNALRRNYPHSFTPLGRRDWEQKLPEEEMLRWAATLDDRALLSFRTIGKTVLAWIRANEPAPSAEVAQSEHEHRWEPHPDIVYRCDDCGAQLVVRSPI